MKKLPSVAEMDAATVQGLLELARDLARTTDLALILQRIARAIREVAGFECAALSLVNETGDLKMVTIEGPQDLVDSMLGTVGEREGWDTVLARGKRFGDVIFDDSALIPEILTETWMSSDASWFERTQDDSRAWRPEYLMCVPMYDPERELLGIVGVDLPFSGLIPEEPQLVTLQLLAHHAERAIVASQRLTQSAEDEHIFASLFETSLSPMMICDRSGAILRSNPQFHERFDGAATVEVLDKFVHEFETGDTDLTSLSAWITQRFTRPDEVSTFTIGTNPKTEAHWFEVSAKPVGNHTQAPQRVVCTFRDVTASRRLRKIHQHDAEHDQLTGLLNRRGLGRAVDQLYASAADKAQPMAVVFGDLDNFKSANDRFGHLYGDDVLIEVAKKLKSVMPPDAILARIGGDEFLAVFNCLDKEQAQQFADRVKDEVRVSVANDPDDAVSISVGMSYISKLCPACDIVALVDEADEALSRQKLNRAKL